MFKPSLALFATLAVLFSLHGLASAQSDGPPKRWRTPPVMEGELIRSTKTVKIPLSAIDCKYFEGGVNTYSPKHNVALTFPSVGTWDGLDGLPWLKGETLRGKFEKPRPDTCARLLALWNPTGTKTHLEVELHRVVTQAIRPWEKKDCMVNWTVLFKLDVPGTIVETREEHTAFSGHSPRSGCKRLVPGRGESSVRQHPQADSSYGIKCVKGDKRYQLQFRLSSEANIRMNSARTFHSEAACDKVQRALIAEAERVDPGNLGEVLVVTSDLKLNEVEMSGRKVLERFHYSATTVYGGETFSGSKGVQLW